MLSGHAMCCCWRLTRLLSWSGPPLRVLGDLSLTWRLLYLRSLECTSSMKSWKCVLCSCTADKTRAGSSHHAQMPAHTFSAAAGALSIRNLIVLH